MRLEIRKQFKITTEDGIECIYEGVLHSTTKPAYRGDDEKWFYQGELHRDDDKPAVTYKNGRQMWYKHGMLHRDGNEPAYIHPNGARAWHTDGKKHREDGPAVIKKDGTKEWWLNGERQPDPQ